MTELPPLGLTPRMLWVEYRMDELWQAIMRYIKAGILPQQEWLDEWKEHERWVSDRYEEYRAQELLNPAEKVSPDVE